MAWFWFGRGSRKRRVEARLIAVGQARGRGVVAAHFKGDRPARITLYLQDLRLPYMTPVEIIAKGVVIASAKAVEGIAETDVTVDFDTASALKLGARVEAHAAGGVLLAGLAREFRET